MKLDPDTGSGKVNQHIQDILNYFPFLWCLSLGASAEEAGAKLHG